MSTDPHGAVPSQHINREEWKDEDGMWHVRCECNHVSSRASLDAARKLLGLHIARCELERGRAAAIEGEGE